MLTLFMSIAGGVSWEDALSPLRHVSELAVIFMLVFIVITVFAVLNVVTGELRFRESIVRSFGSVVG